MGNTTGNPDRELPEPRSLETAEPIAPEVLVLPAFAYEEPLDERAPWLKRYAVVDAVEVPGTDSPLYLTEEDVAITTTGIGKSDAAATVAVLFSSDGLDLESTTVVSAGIAGGSPARVALGSVVLADAVVDWDRKHRWDPREERTGVEPDRVVEESPSTGPGDGLADEGEDESTANDGEDGAPADVVGSDVLPRPPEERPPIDLLAYRPRDYVHRLNERLLAEALESVAGVDLQDRADVRAYQERYPDATEAGPTVDVGPTVCGDEFWHGRRYAAEVEWLCARYGAGPYVTTQMEDAATATVLERFDALDRYLSVRSVVNYDRPAEGQTVEESFDGTAASVEQGVENLIRVGGTIVDTLLE